MAVTMVSSTTGVAFGGFQRRVASFRVAGVALRDIQTCFVTCRKWFCVAGTILLRRFQKMHCRSLQFSWQAQHFGRVHRHFACVRAASSGDNVQIPWQTWHFVRCAAH